MSKEEIPTEPITVEWIMRDPSFERGVRDARAGKPCPDSFDTWEVNSAWNYERGRAWASRVPASVVLKRDGRVTDEVLHWFVRLGDDIL
jgi:hypothetical protein